MRILFVYPDMSSSMTHYTGVLSNGVALLSAVLRREGHETSLLHMVDALDEDEFRAVLADSAPDMVAFSSNSHYASRLPRWAKWARRASSAPIVVGGIHASIATERVEAIEEVDFICVGEGEEALPELCRVLEEGRDPSKVRNFLVRGDGGWHRNPPRPVVEDLDSLPDPHYGLFDFENLFNIRRGYFPFLMSRGCAWSCRYCCCEALRQVSGSEKGFWRFMSPEGAVAQLRRLMELHPVPVEVVQFMDTVLFPNKAWLRRFAPIYRDEIGLPINANLRADMVDEEVAALLRDAGCETIRFGVESGDEWMTRDVLDRRLGVEDIRRAFRCLEEVGIRRWSYNILGLPREDLRRAVKTVRLNGEIRPDLAIPFIFYPYPGTQLHELCEREGWILEREYDHYFQGVMIEQPSISRGDVLFLHRFFRPLARLYGLERRLPARLRDPWKRMLDGLLASPLLPRAPIWAAFESYRRLRHSAGEFLVSRSPRLYRLLGGTDPL